MIALGTIVFALSWHREASIPAQAPRSSMVASPVPNAESAAVSPAKVVNAAPSRSVRAAVVKPKAASSVGSSTLLIGIDYPFEDGTVSVLSDSRVVYSHALKGDATKHLGLFRKVEGRDLGTVPLATGKHQLRVHVQSSAASYDELKTLAVDMGQGQTRTLQISFHGHRKEMHLDLR